MSKHLVRFVAIATLAVGALFAQVALAASVGSDVVHTVCIGIDFCGPSGNGNFGFSLNFSAGLQGYEPPEPSFSTPPPAPTCTLTADPTSIKTGESSTLHWVMSNFSNFTLTNFSIVPPNTAQTVVADCSSIGYQYQDCPLNVPIASVQSISVVEQYSYCNKMSPYDCTPMPGTNYGITNGNHLWVDKGYRARFSITYVPTGSTVPVSSGTGDGLTTIEGNTLVTPPVTTEYKINFTGPGGSAECKATVTVTPPNTGCIKVLKETYNTAGAILTPVPQFSFKLDGGTTVQNDETGLAIFNNVPAGVHTVTEVNPGSAWTLLQATPQNGQVVVAAGQTCAAISFKNKQVVTEQPKGCVLTLKKEILSGAGTHLQPGDLVEYKITVKNTGDEKCTGGGVKIMDMLQGPQTFIELGKNHSSNIDEGYNGEPLYTASDHTLRWNANVLDPNEEGWVKFKVQIGTPTQCTMAVFNKAKVSADQYDSFQTWVDSNTTTIGIEKDCTPPPAKGCIMVKKETYDTQNHKLSPTAQFTFKLDGNSASTTVNDETGTAMFTNVTPGVHTVSEVDGGPNWTQTSVLPSGGTVTVASGPTCAIVTFKNKQVVTHEPKGCILTLKKELIGDDHVSPGDRVHYKITVKNIGDENCTGGGVKIVDVIDPELTFYPLLAIHTSNIDPGYNGEPFYTQSNHTLRWNANVLSPGEEGTVEFRATVDTPSQCTATIPNKAKVSADQYDNFNEWVESNTVNVSVSKDCAPPTDVCPNIDGNQATVPEGKQLVDGQCIDIPTTQTPQCTLTSSTSTFNPGDPITLTWTSLNAIYGSIDHNVGTVNPVSGGSTPSGLVFPQEDTTYTGTFGDGHATTTCTVRVTKTGGGGGCFGGSCGGGGGGGGGMNQPNVVLFNKPGSQPLAFVSLSQVPYTGFEAGPLLTFAFWLAVALWSAGIAYVLMGKRGMRLIAERVFAFAPNVAYNEGAYGEPTYTAVEVAPTSEEPVLEATMTMPAVSVMPLAAPIPKEPAVNGIPALADVIESRAHAAGVLLSPEALSLALALSTDRATTLVAFGDILNQAVKTIPREDGWILLSSDRFSDLTKTVAAPAPVAPLAHASVEMGPTLRPDAAPLVTDSAVSRLAEAVITHDRDAAFSLIRTAEHDNVDPLPLMTGVASLLDQLYHARRDGTHFEDLALSEKAANLSDSALEKLVDVFTHSTGKGYSSPFTGVKLALAQAFEVR